jgi:hypothetical protein
MLMRRCGLFLVLVPAVKRQAGRAEHFIAELATLGVGVAHGSPAVAAPCRRIPAARLPRCVLDASDFGQPAN